MPSKLSDFAYQPNTREARLMAELNGTKKPRRGNWTQTERLSLVAMSRWFSFSGASRASIMNRLFKVPHGHSKEFTANACTAQISEVMKPIHTSVKYKDIYKKVFEEEDLLQPSASMKRLLTRIEDIACLLHIQTRERPGAPVLGQPRKQASASTSSRRPANFVRDYHHIEQATPGHERIPSSSSSRTDFLLTDDEEDDKQKVEVIDLTSDEVNSSSLSHSSTPLSSPLSDQPAKALTTTSSAHYESSPSQQSSLAHFRELSEALPETPYPTRRLGRLERPALPQDFPAAKVFNSSSSAIAEFSPPAVLLRTYTVNSGGINEKARFRAGAFNPTEDTIPRSPSTEDEYFLYSFARHLRRDRFDSPFISFSPSLVWVLYKAFESMAAGTAPEEVFISEIQGELAAHRGLWHAKPLLSRVRKTWPRFWPYIHRFYTASQEWVSWGEVSSAAIQVSTNLKEIMQLDDSNKAIASVLRLKYIQDASSMGNLRREFFLNQVMISDCNVIGLAKILLFFNITPSSKASIIEAGVYTILQNWVIYVPDEQSLREIFKYLVLEFYDRCPSTEIHDLGEATKAFIRGGLAAKEDLAKERKLLCLKKGAPLQINFAAAPTSTIVQSIETIENQPFMDDYDEPDAIMKFAEKVDEDSLQRMSADPDLLEYASSP